MNDMLDAGYEEPLKKRPVFITVLCILTFVSCGLTFISSLWRLLVGNNTEESIKSLNRLSRQTSGAFQEMSSSMEKVMEWQTTSDLLALANVLLCLVGALLMWRLKKVGFFIYTFGQVLPFIALFGMYSAVQDVPFLGMAMLIGSFLAALFALGFIVMYGINLKHMR